MDYRPSEGRLFEWYKQRGILAPNKNPELQNRPISLVRFEKDQLIKCSDSTFFKYSGSVLWGYVIHIFKNKANFNQNKVHYFFDLEYSKPKNAFDKFLDHTVFYKQNQKRSQTLNVSPSWLFHWLACLNFVINVLLNLSIKFYYYRKKIRWTRFTGHLRRGRRQL
jgi:hypothetical protein